jgi:hypothetical protein
LSERSDDSMTAIESPPAAPEPKLRWYQYSLRTLLLVVLIWSVLCAWMFGEFRKAHQRSQVYKHIALDMYTTDLGEFPWYSAWLHGLFGDEECYDPTFLVFNNFGSINDDTLAEVAQLESLEQLWLNGDISITDTGLNHLKGLTHLRDLSLGHAPVTAKAVERLRQALPECEISWVPPTPDERQIPTAPDQLGG